MTLCVATVDRSSSGNLIFKGNLDDVAPGETLDTITDSQIKRFIALIVEKEDSL